MFFKVSAYGVVNYIVSVNKIYNVNLSRICGISLTTLQRRRNGSESVRQALGENQKV
jgi:hypothetical protein